jgi:hypothetical protein
VATISSSSNFIASRVPSVCQSKYRVLIDIDAPLLAILDTLYTGTLRFENQIIIEDVCFHRPRSTLAGSQGIVLISYLLLENIIASIPEKSLIQYIRQEVRLSNVDFSNAGFKKLRDCQREYHYG